MKRDESQIIKISGTRGQDLNGVQDHCGQVDRGIERELMGVFWGGGRPPGFSTFCEKGREREKKLPILGSDPPPNPELIRLFMRKNIYKPPFH